MNPIPLSSPDVGEEEIRAVVEVMRTPQLSLGPKLPEFEEKVADVAGVSHAVAVNSGTSALHLIVKAMGIGPGYEVITTPFSFVASANCMLFEGATPVFVDIEPQTLNIDVTKIEAAITPRTKAILAVDVFGQPADWDALSELANKHNLRLIEDSAESIGARYKSRPAGGLGDAGLFAFYPNKQITTGEGGVVVTDDEEIARLCRSYRNQGRGEGSAWLQHERMGYNFRLSDINCALGIVQLARLPEILKMRANVAKLYAKYLSEIDGVKVPYVGEHVEMSWFVYVIQLSERHSRADRDGIQRQLTERGIANSNYFSPIHLQPFYAEQYGYKPGDFPVTEQVSDRTIALPFHNRLSEAEIARVAEALSELVK